jgi:hypothetical protein
MAEKPSCVGYLRCENASVSADMAAVTRSILSLRDPIVELAEAGHHPMLDQPLPLVATLRALLEFSSITRPTARRAPPRPACADRGVIGVNRLVESCVEFCSATCDIRLTATAQAKLEGLSASRVSIYYRASKHVTSRRLYGLPSSSEE